MTAAIRLPELPQELFPELSDSLRPPSGELAALGALSQIAPGVWVSGRPAFELPTHLLCRIILGPSGGTFTLEPEPFPGYLRVTDDIGLRLGIIGLSITTLRRLLWGGFIDHIRPTPGSIFIAIESLLEHFRRTANDCAADKSYWTAARRAQWKITCEGCSNLDD